MLFFEAIGNQSTLLYAGLVHQNAECWLNNDTGLNIRVYSLSLEACVNKIALPLIKCNKEFITFVIVLCCRNCS